MRIEVTDDAVEVMLAPWQKVLGLMRDIRVARADISDVRVVEDPVREAMGTGIKVGLRLPWLYYVARTIRLDQVFVVRRGVPGPRAVLRRARRRAFAQGARQHARRGPRLLQRA
jgi:hypothetical protein